MRVRQRQIIATVERVGNMSEVGRLLGVSRQRVHQVVTRYKSGKLKEYTPTYYEDTGCPDGEYPSCLNCPLKNGCKYE